MGESYTAAAIEAEIAEEDILRAQLYRLLYRLLAAPPDAAFLATVGQLQGDDSEFGTALGALANAAAATAAETAGEEFHELFIGLGRGELVPVGSYYLTDFLYERPLASPREDMARIGATQADDVKEPEDHIASVADIMAGLILGEFGAPVALAEQRAFFDKHVDPWAGKFFEDLEAAKAASLYRSVGTVGRCFMGIEATAFQMIG